MRWLIQECPHPLLPNQRKGSSVAKRKKGDGGVTPRNLLRSGSQRFPEKDFYSEWSGKCRTVPPLPFYLSATSAALDKVGASQQRLLEKWLP